MFETCRPLRSIAAGRANGDRHVGRRADNGRVELLALLLALLLRVVQSRQREPLGTADPLEVDQHPGGEQRSGEGPTAGLVHSGHEAAAEGAIEAKSLAGGALLPPPLRCL